MPRWLYWLGGSDLPDRRERTNVMRRYKIALLFGVLALAGAACGTNDDAPDDNGGGGEAPLADALAYSECMRDNGLEDFPDPSEDGGGGGLTLPEGMDDESEEFQAAENACEDLMPGPGPEDLIDADLFAELIRYAECMREQGIADFPDPEEDGLNVHFDELGIDPDSEEYQAALTACEDERPADDGGLHDGTDE